MPKSDASFDPRAYATVAERVSLFYEQFPAGRINTELVARDEREIVFKALVYRQTADVAAAATGWASERLGDGDVNAVACMENTETSAVGRALANLGFTASTRRPSREEMEKAERARQVNARLQGRADEAHDVLSLLTAASRRGFPDARVAIIRAHVTRGDGLTLPRVRRLEQRLRGWIRRRDL